MFEFKMMNFAGTAAMDVNPLGSWNTADELKLQKQDAALR